MYTTHLQCQLVAELFPLQKTQACERPPESGQSKTARVDGVCPAVDSTHRRSLLSTTNIQYNIHTQYTVKYNPKIPSVKYLVLLSQTYLLNLDLCRFLTSLMKTSGLPLDHEESQTGRSLFSAKKQE